jgi:hypothetical protein
VARVKDITGGAGARIIFDPIAGPLLDKLAEASAPWVPFLSMAGSRGLRHHFHSYQLSKRP